MPKVTVQGVYKNNGYFKVSCNRGLSQIRAAVTIITGLFLMQYRAVEQHQGGAANGIAMTDMSIFKAIGPAGDVLV
ncbi:protein zinc induced facilitator-like 1-like [Trifolium pratense]|uniref:Protein zinc induced facilitator-like 1-like n=1 Tax=Trifolium pratense TaxID=57577 RepID=A0A2K3NWQ3_TRIPR|nr:protein zinc induced facilitator-like 1-like [Trifolium pratense]